MYLKNILGEKDLKVRKHGLHIEVHSLDFKPKFLTYESVQWDIQYQPSFINLVYYLTAKVGKGFFTVK